MNGSPVLMVVVAASGAGKGVLLRSLRDMGDRHIVVVPKVTTRKAKTSDGGEMISLWPDKTIADPRYDIKYLNYEAQYGIATGDIFDALRSGRSGMLICSNFETAIPELKAVFGLSMKLLYLYAPIKPADTKEHQRHIAAEKASEIAIRMEGIEIVHKYYVDNIAIFDHVLINVGLPEDLSDQLFRILRSYHDNPHH
jgi:ribose 1,5-bisphosphokinase PhnN